MKNINLKLLVPVLVSFTWISLLFPFGNSQAQVKKNQNLRSVMSTDYCDALTITANLGSNITGCYIDVIFNQPWTAGSNANVMDLPHGILFELDGPATIITPASNLSGAWFSGANQSSTNSNNIFFNKQPVATGTGTFSGSNNPGNTLTSGQTLSFRVYIVPNAASPITITIKELTGWSWQNDITKWNCMQIFKFEKPKAIYTISKDTICAGSATILNLSTNIPTGVPPSAIIQWFKAPFPCPLTVPPAGWTPVQTGGITYPTGILNASFCYTAIITDGCYSYVSNVSTVTVCQALSTIGNISANPISPSTPLQNINGVWHACGVPLPWKGTLTLPSLGITCPSSIIWTKQLNGGTPTGLTCNPLPLPGQQCLNPETGSLVAPSPMSPLCANIYTFTAKIENKCGFTTRTFQIVIDKATQPGKITANQNLVGSGTINKPNLCFDGYTVLNCNVGCGDIKEWQYSEIKPDGTYPPMQLLSGAGTSSTYWTNGLKVTTRYQVKVQNGACNSAFTPVMTVLVKPMLTVNITTNNTSICPLPNPTIYATLPPGYPTAGLTYEWYKDGILITTAPPPLDVTLLGSGNYYVIVKDAQCGSAQSNVISICGKPDVVISGACGICPGGSVALEAIVESGCVCTYEWKKVGSTSIISTSASITVNSQGTYTVTVKCGNCVVIRTHTIGLCPNL